MNPKHEFRFNFTCDRTLTSEPRRSNEGHGGAPFGGGEEGGGRKGGRKGKQKSGCMERDGIYACVRGTGRV